MRYYHVEAGDNALSFETLLIETDRFKRLYGEACKCAIILGILIMSIAICMPYANSMPISL